MRIAVWVIFECTCEPNQTPAIIAGIKHRANPIIGQLKIRPEINMNSNLKKVSIKMAKAMVALTTLGSLNRKFKYEA